MECYFVLVIVLVLEGWGLGWRGIFADLFCG